MRKNRKWIITAIILILLAVLVYAVGRNTVRLPYFLSGSMGKYLLNIPEGENAKDLILSHCEEISSQVIDEIEFKQYSCDEAALQSMLPEDGSMHQVETSDSGVYFALYLTYKLPKDVTVLLIYDASGWNHTIVKYEKSDWVFVLTKEQFEVTSPWAGLVWW